MGEPVITKEVWKSPLIVSFDGDKRYRGQCDVTRVDYWRDTIFGPVNFGFVHKGPMRMVEVLDE